MINLENIIINEKYIVEETSSFQPPQKEGTGYKLFNYKNGKLYPLFIGAKEPTPMGVWIEAEDKHIEAEANKFANRPGWHIGSDIPDAPWLKSHDGTDKGFYASPWKEKGKRLNRVWAKVAYPMDINYQAEADKNPSRDIKNTIPKNGYYLFKESNRGTWVITGAIKVLDIISEEERQDILNQEGYNEVTAYAPYKKASEKRQQTLQSKKEPITETFKIDHADGDWLKNKAAYVMRKGKDDHGVPFMDAVTGYFTTSVIVPVKVLASIPGENGEQLKPRQYSLDNIMKIMKDTGKLPLDNGEEYVPYIEVAYDGSAWVSEGNHRIMAADRLGWKTLPVEIRYFDGGDTVEDGVLSPTKFVGDSYKG